MRRIQQLAQLRQHAAGGLIQRYAGHNAPILTPVPTSVKSGIRAYNFHHTPERASAAQRQIAPSVARTGQYSASCGRAAPT